MKKLNTYQTTEKRNGNTYAYKITTEYDTETQKSKNIKKKYLGKVFGKEKDGTLIIKKTRSITDKEILSGIQNTSNMVTIETFNGKELFQKKVSGSTDKNTKLKTLNGKHVGYYLDDNLTAFHNKSHSDSLCFIQKNLETSCGYCGNKINHRALDLKSINYSSLDIEEIIPVYLYNSEFNNLIKNMRQRNREFIMVYDTKSPRKTDTIDQLKKHAATIAIKIPNSPYEILSTVRDIDDSYIRRWGELLLDIQHFKRLYDELFPDSYATLTGFYNTLKTTLKGSSLSLKQLIKQYESRLKEIDSIREITYPKGRKEIVKVVDPGIVDELRGKN